MKILILYSLFLISVLANAEPLRMCGYKSQQDTCRTLPAGTQVKCIDVQDSVQCIRKIQRGEADFGTFYPEQALLAKEVFKDEVGVIAEIRNSLAEYRNDSYQTVVVVRKEADNNFNGKKFCHLGLVHDEIISFQARKQFEDYVLKTNQKNTCDRTSSIPTTLELEIKALSEVFGESCRAGTWTGDYNEEKKLKKKYSKLCALCDNRIECSYNNDGDVNERPLKCLANGGDIALTTADAVYNYFRDKPEAQNYQLLCPNGTRKTIISGEYDRGCAWRNQPWKTVLAKTDKLSSVQEFISKNIPVKYVIRPGNTPFGMERGKFDWADRIAELLLEDTNNNKIYFPNNLQNIKNYFESNQQSIRFNDMNCKSVKWCTISSDELDKCEWLAIASKNAGIRPEIECVRGQSVFDCLSRIKSENADFMAIESNYAYVARRNNVRDVLFTQVNDENLSRIVAVTKTNVNINSLKDIQNTKICFPEFAGLAWISFAETAHALKLIKDNCDYGKSISDYFSGGCAPGVEEARRFKSADTNTARLCSSCKHYIKSEPYCGADFNNKYYKSNGSLACLRDGAADIAIVDLSNLNDNDKNDVNFKVLCKDGATTKPLQQVNNDCVLSATINSEIIARPDDPFRDNYKLVLFDMEEAFGPGTKKKIHVMEMFSSFDGKDDLLFSNKLIGFDTYDPYNADENDKFITNYVDLLKTPNKCTGGAAAVTSSTVLLFALYCLCKYFM